MTTTRDYSLVGVDGQRAVASGLASAEWYRTPVDRKRMKQLMQRRDAPAIRDTAIWLGLMVIFAAIAIWQWFSIWSVLALLAYGVLYGSASDSRWHEAGHGTAFRTQWMNTGVYNIACFMIMRNPTAWRWSHTRHHTDTIITGRDPEIVAQRPPKLGRIALNFFGVFDVPEAMATMLRHVGGRISPDEATYIPESERPKVVRTARVWLVIYVGMVVACVVVGSVLPALLIGLPRCYGAWHHLLTGMVQHCGLAEDVTDHRLNARTAYMNPISRFIYWNMNYHLEHHMYPMVPFHALKALHEEIKHDLPAPSTSILAAYREFIPVLLQQRTDPSVYIHRDLRLTTPPEGMPPA
jgi:fatty acid desaturase